MELDVTQSKPTLNQRHNFAVKHMIAAARFCRHCYEVEHENAGQPFGPFYNEILSYVSATILSTVAALEANINESFADVQDGIIIVDSIEVQTPLDSWKDMERLQILEKYDRFLELAGKDKMDRGVRNYQFAKIIIGVRNALVHYKPEWQAQQKRHKKIGKQLKGKFELSPFLDENAPIFPMRCMTYNFAEWTVRSGLAFAGWFADSAEIPNRFAKFDNNLHTAPEKMVG